MIIGTIKEEYLVASHQGYKIPVELHDNIECSMGSYDQINNRQILITELPRGIWHTSYIYGNDTERCSICKDKPKACNKCKIN